MYDIIGDIHGHADELIEILIALGYQQEDCKKINNHQKEQQTTKFYYRHPTNKVIFLGDFIDRGPKQRETIEIVMAMVNQGAALTVMGNHELNAIAYHTAKKNRTDLNAKNYLRPHSQKNLHQHQAFLTAYSDEQERDKIINWFKTLPLWLNIDELRIIHACWDQTVIDRVKQKLQGNTLNESTLHEALTFKTPLFADIETLLKGIEISLPKGMGFTDSDGHERNEVRVRWWLSGAISINEVALYPEIVNGIDRPINADRLPGYAENNQPCFIGHYWYTGKPHLILSNLACVDYSIAKKGKLVAYRFKGESILKDENFFWVR